MQGIYAAEGSSKSPGIAPYRTSDLERQYTPTMVAHKATLPAIGAHSLAVSTNISGYRAVNKTSTVEEPTASTQQRHPDTSAATSAAGGQAKPPTTQDQPIYRPLAAPKPPPSPLVQPPRPAEDSSLTSGATGTLTSAVTAALGPRPLDNARTLIEKNKAIRNYSSNFGNQPSVSQTQTPAESFRTAAPHSHNQNITYE